MKISDIIKDCPSLTDEVIREAYLHVVRTVKLQPILLSVKTDRLRAYDFTKDILMVRRASLETPLGQYALTDYDNFYLIDHDGRYLIDI